MKTTREVTRETCGTCGGAPPIKECGSCKRRFGGQLELDGFGGTT